ncbi:zinc/manganese transport system substrate-binding protein [Tamaricihabitans halophyticus]|uniref:Zinc/manganese transport system substrate-binding protein n=1 Tax=Tamaricihabitans halophyticus TaxID=1262583 RepID=A0A4R2QX04_9PSEU|nr:zinc ABC transporter substrate-binding protein AztC [Tamaricihabitans halophyticus]TCP54247.1 zinc/manganese transport system substrate-binding protein [Tamaricihabitans halophyticus]
MRAKLGVLGVALLLTIAGCAGSGSASGEGGVVVTTNILGDLTEAVVGDQVPVTVLMKPNADPHSFAISAQEAAQLEQADLVVHNGLGLEEGVQRNVDAAEESGVPTLAVGDQVDPISYRDNESAGEPDPHFWTDPRRVHTAVELIADQVVSEVDGVDEETTRANARAYLAEVEELDGWMADQFAAIPEQDRKLVTNHHVFGYLAQRYEFEVLGAVLPSGTTLASPSASDLSELAGTIRKAGVAAIFADSSQPDRLAKVLAEQAGLEVRVLSLYSESLTGPEGSASTYLDMMRVNTTTIADGLSRN